MLADSEIHTLPTIKLIAARHNLSWDSLRDEYGGWTWAAIADELLANIASHTAALPSTDILSDELAAAFSQSVLSSPIAVPGAIEAVKAAAQVGRVAVVTGSRSALVEAWLNHFHIRQYVELIVSAETYERAKPAPDAYRTALERFMAEAGETIVFEDSPAGVTAAIAAELCVYVIGETPLPLNLKASVLGQFTDFTDPTLIRRMMTEHGLDLRANAD